MADTDITICNGALALLGTSSITDFTSNDKSKICGQIYPKYANTLLSMHNWRFARKKSGALSTTTAPDNAWTYAFSLPNDYLKLINVYNSGDASAHPLTGDYEIFGNTIVTNQLSLYIDYTYEVDEDLWPDYYQTFVMGAMAARLAIPITEDADKEKYYREISFGSPSEKGQGGIYALTKIIDSEQQPLIDLPTQSLIAARFSY